MNFETISRFHFKPIEKEMRSFQETFRINAHNISMTKAMYERMEKPEHLLFAYDAEERAVGIKIVGDNESNSVSVQEKGRSPYVNNSKYICEKIASEMQVDLESKSIILRRGYRANEWFIFELRYADIVGRCGRKVKQ